MPVNNKRMAFRFGLPLAIGSAGALFVASMFEEAVTTPVTSDISTPSDIGQAVSDMTGAPLATQPTSTVEGAQTTVSPVSSVEGAKAEVNPNINIAGPQISLIPSWLGGPAPAPAPTPSAPAVTPAPTPSAPAVTPTPTPSAPTVTPAPTPSAPPSTLALTPSAPVVTPVPAESSTPFSLGAETPLSFPSVPKDTPMVQKPLEFPSVPKDTPVVQKPMEPPSVPKDTPVLQSPEPVEERGPKAETIPVIPAPPTIPSEVSPDTSSFEQLDDSDTYLVNDSIPRDQDMVGLPTGERTPQTPGTLGIRRREFTPPGPVGQVVPEPERSNTYLVNDNIPRGPDVVGLPTGQRSIQTPGTLGIRRREFTPPGPIDQVAPDMVELPRAERTPQTPMSLGIRRREFTPSGPVSVTGQPVVSESVDVSQPMPEPTPVPDIDLNRRTMFDDADKPTRYSYRYIGNQRVAIPR